MNLDYYVISENASIKEALQQISKNKHGIVMLTNSNGTVTGVATDGDIRDRLINGLQLTDAIETCANRNFVWANNDTPREQLLKQLDNKIRLIPLLSKERKLIGVFSRENIPVKAEERTYTRARSPVRISFGGGGSDLTHFFANQSGAVINTTISLYSHATLRVRDDERIIIYSRDINDKIEAENLQELFSKKGKFGLIQALLKVISPDFGFDLFLHSDFPINSGLGGSAAVSAALLGCFNQLRNDRWDLHELAELAFQAERLYLGVAGGWQDQYATVFGGFNFMEFKLDQNIVHPLRIHRDTLLELEESLILCDTGIKHDSGNIHDDQREQMKQDEIRKFVTANLELTYKMRNHLLRGRLSEFARAIHEAWQFKRKLSAKISNNNLDSIYESARNHGAVGGKLLGAGGGGFFLFFTPPFKKYEVIENLENQGLKIRPFRFEQEGMYAWSVRDKIESMEINED